MGQITTGVGLVSGLDINNIVEQLIAIEARPKQLAEQRNEVIRSQQVAFQDISARLLALKGSSDKLSGSTAFSGTTSNSSNESVISVSSGVGATPGTYKFTVGRLVAAQQSITRGFQDANVTPIAPDGATMTFDRGESRLDSETRLSNLNGGEGIGRGYIRITDRAGSTAIVDLRSVVSVNDVIDRINTNTSANVLAQIDGDRLTLTDVSGGTGDLLVSDVGLTGTATALGLAGTGTGDGDGDDAVRTGTVINTVGRDTLLSSLNDGKGIRVDGGADLSITDGAGTTFTVDLSDKLTLGDTSTPSKTPPPPRAPPFLRRSTRTARASNWSTPAGRGKLPGHLGQRLERAGRPGPGRRRDRHRRRRRARWRPRHRLDQLQTHPRFARRPGHRRHRRRGHHPRRQLDPARRHPPRRRARA